MISKLLSRCIDINTEHCPCLLAETNHCVFCSHLKGELTCNCNWTGTCIYYEKQWQSKKEGHRFSRVEVDCIPKRKEEIGPHTYLLELVVTPAMAQALANPGAYVFLRRTGDPDYFSFPVGIMGVTEDSIEMVIEGIGPKSTRVLQDSTTSITVRGSYGNGIFGQPWIDNTKSSKVVLITGGMGQPPAMPVARTLVRNGNKVMAIVAPGKVGHAFIAPWLEALGIEVVHVPSLRQNGMPLLREILANRDMRPDLVVSAGPDEQHYGVIAAMQTVNINLPMAATNNATMCCGEGICGSCEKVTRDNKKVKTCKVQTDFTQFICD